MMGGELSPQEEAEAREAALRRLDAEFQFSATHDNATLAKELKLICAYLKEKDKDFRVKAEKFNARQRSDAFNETLADIRSDLLKTKRKIASLTSKRQKIFKRHMRLMCDKQFIPWNSRLEDPKTKQKSEALWAWFVREYPAAFSGKLNMTDGDFLKEVTERYDGAAIIYTFKRQPEPRQYPAEAIVAEGFDPHTTRRRVALETFDVVLRLRRV